MTVSSRTQKKSLQQAGKVYYPAVLDLTDKKCLIVGGGRVAERKCLALIRSHASITVISPRLTRRLEKYEEKGLIKHSRRAYQSRDIKPAFIVIAATDSDEINRKISADAARLNKLINVVDNPALCNFIVPSVLNRGPLTIAVSTGGSSPALAKAIKKELEGLYGPEFSKLLRILRGIRSRAMKEISDKKEREKFLKEIGSRIFARPKLG